MVGVLVASVVVAFLKVPFAWWIFGIAAAWMILLRLLPLASVEVAESYIEIKPVFPFLAARHVLNDDVSHYEDCPMSLRGKSVPFWGRLHHRNGKHTTIWASGTQDFAELAALLAAKFVQHHPEFGMENNPN